MQPPVEKPSRLSSCLRRLRRWVWNTLAVLGLFFVIYHSCFELAPVVSGSMKPTLQGEGGPDSDWILAERVSYWFRRPRRWEVAQFYSEDHLLVAKRVVGLPGERIAVVDNRVLIDGEPMPFPESLGFLRYYSYGCLHQGRQADCERGFFVMGDDSRDSMDSRFEGTIPPERIRARTWLIVWPPARIGFVNQ